MELRNWTRNVSPRIDSLSELKSYVQVGGGNRKEWIRGGWNQAGDGTGGGVTEGRRTGDEMGCLIKKEVLGWQLSGMRSCPITHYSSKKRT